MCIINKRKWNPIVLRECVIKGSDTGIMISWLLNKKNILTHYQQCVFQETIENTVFRKQKKSIFKLETPDTLR